MEPRILRTLLCAFICTAPLPAATVSWDGGGGNSFWGNAANWSNDSGTTASDDVQVLVNTNLRGAGDWIFDLNSNEAAASLLLDYGASSSGRIAVRGNGSLAMDGTTVTVGTSHSDSGTITIACNTSGNLDFNISANSDGTFANSSSAEVSIQGVGGNNVVFGGAGGVETVYFDGAGDLLLGADVVIDEGTGGGGLDRVWTTSTFSGTLTLGGDTDFMDPAADFRVQGGTVAIGADEQIGDDTQVAFGGTASGMTLDARGVTETVANAALADFTDTGADPTILVDGSTSLVFADLRAGANAVGIDLSGWVEGSTSLVFTDLGGTFYSGTVAEGEFVEGLTAEGFPVTLTEVSDVDGDQVDDWAVSRVIGTADYGGFTVLGWIPAYRLDMIPIEHLTHVTHIVHHGFSPDADTAGELLEAYEGGNWPLTQSHRDKIDAIRVAYPDAKLLMGILGSDDVFAPATANSTVRATFIANIRDYCLQYGYDGVDYDWEYPDDGADGSGQDQYSALLVETAADFASYGLEVSFADDKWGIYLSQAAYDAVDRVNFMGGYLYNTNSDGSQAPFAESLGGLHGRLEAGAVRADTTLGLPFFAQSYEVAGRVTTTYRSLQLAYGPLDPAADEIIDGSDHWVFNGIDHLADKVAYVRDNGFGGVCIWELTQDTWTAADQSLLINGIVPGANLAASQTAWTLLAFDNFEGASYNWSAAGNDADIPESERAHSGGYSAMVRDNSGKRSSVEITVDLSGYTECIIDFWFSAKNYEWQEDFFVEVNTSGNNWSAIGQFEQGIPNLNGFPNGSWINAEVGIDDSSISFTSGVKFRIRSDASDNSDIIFLDNIVVRAR